MNEQESKAECVRQLANIKREIAELQQQTIELQDAIAEANAKFPIGVRIIFNTNPALNKKTAVGLVNTHLYRDNDNTDYLVSLIRADGTVGQFQRIVSNGMNPRLAPRP